jgi:hypothetical protein
VRAILEGAVGDGRELRSEEISAVAQADKIASQHRNLRDELIRRDAEAADLEGVRDEFRRVGAGRDIEGELALRDISGRSPRGRGEIELDHARSRRTGRERADPSFGSSRATRRPRRVVR